MYIGYMFESLKKITFIIILCFGFSYSQSLSPSGDMTANTFTVNASNNSNQGNITLNGLKLLIYIQKL